MTDKALIDRAEKWVAEGYNLTAKATFLGSYEDLNFKLTDEHGQHYLLKIAAQHTPLQLLQAQNQILHYLQEHHPQADAFPKVLLNVGKNDIYEIHINGVPRYARLLTYLRGSFLQKAELTETLLRSFGTFLGQLWETLKPLELLALSAQQSCWNLQYASKCAVHLDSITSKHYSRIAQYFLHQYQQNVLPRLDEVPSGIIHNDANDHNVLSDDTSITGIIDFGDACHSARVHDLAIALPYLMMKSDQPLQVVSLVVGAYNEVSALETLELDLLYYMINARLAVSLTMSSASFKEHPENEYLLVHQQPVKKLMDYMMALNPRAFQNILYSACDRNKESLTPVDLFSNRRHQHISPALSLSYKTPLRIYKGAMQYLYEENGQTYLDGVNNICHVGHSNPQIVQAVADQWSNLNTNTRYLYHQLNDFSARLASMLPDPLSVVFLVNSGSEANDLALRMARTHTKSPHMLVLEGAYHGNSSATIALSPYKYMAKGGPGPTPLVHQIPMPDLFRGIYAQEANADKMHVKDVVNRIKQLQQEHGSEQVIAGFISESIMSCGGQIVLPDGYLKEVYDAIRAAGGVCIADEVQVGFGRVGSHFWGFQTQDVVPDIVTMGKPMGNGHPLAAVVTTPEIASSFNTGMEYFNSFGGNPVSCAVGNAVLNVIEQEDLQNHALNLGNSILDDFNSLKAQFPHIGDVRGKGLFLGLELVHPGTLKPDARLASALVESMKIKGVLLSTDGPQHNVIKFKPPMVFSAENSHIMLEKLQTTFTELT